MKKVLFIGLIIAFYLGFGNLTERENIIPTEAIRIRVLANSDTVEDQKIKVQVKEKLENYLYGVLSSADNVSEASNIIEDSIPQVEELVDSVFEGEYTINYGMNYFPKKEYKGIVYDEGYYNSLVVSLGEGLGQNWWCILFPPLCLLEGTEMDDVEYRSLVGDIIGKYF